MKTFVVDDSAAFRSALGTLLGSVPAIELVGEAEDTADAIEAILRTSPDAVILDLQLKTGSGLPVLKAVKRLLPKTRFLVVTNLAYGSYRNHCLAAGADDFFDKSKDLDRLIAHCTHLAATGTRQESAP